MKVFLDKSPELIQIQIRAENGGSVGDLTREVRPGGTALGRPFEFWAALGNGEHEIDLGHKEAARG